MARINNLARVVGALTSRAWAMQAEALDELLQLAQRKDVDLVALAAKSDVDVADYWMPYVEGNVAIIPVKGPLFAEASWLDVMCGATSYARIEAHLTEARNDRKVDAIILLGDTPGGEVTGCGELAGYIREIAEEKLVVFYAAGGCCSAGYWLASACSSIVVSPTAIVGCLGVAGTVKDFRKAEEMLGIKSYEIVSTATPDKRPDPATKEGMAQMVGLIDFLAEVFLTDVAINRGVTRAIVDEKFGKGNVFVGKDAVTAGMADELGSLFDVLSVLQKNLEAA